MPVEHLKEAKKLS